MKAMAKDPRERYQSARDFHADLQRAVHGMAVSAPPVVVFERTQAMPQRTAVLPAAPVDEVYEQDWYAEPERRSAASWAVITLLILAGLAAGLFVLTRVFGGTEPMVTIPADVVGMDIAAAEQRLIQLGFNPVLGEKRADPQFGPNQVITTDPAPGRTAPRGSEVRLHYSEGPKQVEVPNLAGMTEEEALRMLREGGFGIGRRELEPSDEVEAGLIVRSAPPAGQIVPEGTEVSIVVSSGPATFEVPSVLNMTEADARRALENVCESPPCVRVVVSREFSESVEEGRVIRQTPEAGEPVEPGATVTIVISRGQESEPTPTPAPTTASPTPSPSPPPTEPTPTEPTPSPSESGGLTF